MESSFSVPDEFAYETRLVVLNFMGLMPASCPPSSSINQPSYFLHHGISTLSGCDTNEHQYKTDVLPAITQTDHSDNEQESKTAEDRTGESLTVIRKATHIRLLKETTSCYANCEVLNNLTINRTMESSTNGFLPSLISTSEEVECDAPSVWITPSSPVISSVDHQLTLNVVDPFSGSVLRFHDTTTTEIEHLASKSLSSEDEFPQKSLSCAESKRSSFVSSRLSPHLEFETMDLLSIDRQSSCQSRDSRRSCSSSRGSSSVRRNSYVDVRQVDDIAGLVRAQTLSPFAVQLKEEISKEIEDLEKSYTCSLNDRPLPCLPPHHLPCQPSLSFSVSVMSPESQVADMLRVIGDRVEDDYSVYLDAATLRLLELQHLTYDVLEETALNLLHQSDHVGWTQVALVMLLGQRVSLSLLSHGDRSVGRLADYTSRFITDHVADFIISKGGWQSITEIGIVETPLPVSSDHDLHEECSNKDQIYDNLSDECNQEITHNSKYFEFPDGGTLDVDIGTLPYSTKVNLSSLLVSENIISMSVAEKNEKSRINDETKKYLKIGEKENHEFIRPTRDDEDDLIKAVFLIGGVCILIVFGTWMLCKRTGKIK